MTPRGRGLRVQIRCTLASHLNILDSGLKDSRLELLEASSQSILIRIYIVLFCFVYTCI
jgi:hypothetical protein